MSVPPAAPESHPGKVLAVVVLYQADPLYCATLRGLAHAFTTRPDLRETYGVLLWDNSPVAQPRPELPFAFEYRHAQHNTGVAGAYNACIVAARERGLEWLLLLDHDTQVTADFLERMATHVGECAAMEHVAAIVPFLFTGAYQLSPRYVHFGRHTPVPAHRSGVERRELFAANSGTLMRVAALEEIGGYSEDFWLDYSDLYVFHQLHLHRKAIYLAADARLQHEIAMLDYDARMTPERYVNFLGAEGAFQDLYKGGLENAAHLLRLLIRAVRQRRLTNTAFSRLTLEAFRRRLLSSRKRRIADWRMENRARG